MYSSKRMHIYSQNIDGFSYAAAPCIASLSEDKILVLYTSRSHDNKSHVFQMVMRLSENGAEIIKLFYSPVLLPGPLGSFDEYGAMASCLLNNNDRYWLYYTGWNLGTSVPFRLSIGLAEKADTDFYYSKLYEGPVMDRSIEDPYLVCSPCVCRTVECFHMWYVSGLKWIHDANGAKHFYHIRYARSKDGLSWLDRGRICIDFQNEHEYALSRPCVIHKNGNYLMWYSFRASPSSETYRIGFAVSKDGMNWERRDNEMDFDVSAEGWDSEMVCYPWVFEYQEKLWMLYNGSGYGKTGFGIARLEM